MSEKNWNNFPDLYYKEQPYTFLGNRRIRVLYIKERNIIRGCNFDPKSLPRKAEWSFMILISPRSAVVRAKFTSLISRILNTPAWTDNVSLRNSQGGAEFRSCRPEQPAKWESAWNKVLTVYFLTERIISCSTVTSFLIVLKEKLKEIRKEYRCFKEQGDASGIVKTMEKRWCQNILCCSFMNFTLDYLYYIFKTNSLIKLGRISCLKFHLLIIHSSNKIMKFMKSRIIWLHDINKSNCTETIFDGECLTEIYPNNEIVKFTADGINYLHRAMLTNLIYKIPLTVNTSQKEVRKQLELWKDGSCLEHDSDELHAFENGKRRTIDVWLHEDPPSGFVAFKDPSWASQM